MTTPNLLEEAVEEFWGEVFLPARDEENERWFRKFLSDFALDFLNKSLENIPEIPYDPSIPQDVMSEMDRDMRNLTKGIAAANRMAVINAHRLLGLTDKKET